MATDKLVDFDHVTDYISREAAIERFCNVYCGCSPEECGFKIPQDGAEECAAVRALKEVPAADVVEVRHGRWEYEQFTVMYGNPYGCYRCSACGDASPHISNYCPNCGADMREVKADG